MKKTVFFIISLLLVIKLSAQGVDCSSATQFCTGTTSTYPANTNVTSPDPGTYPNYGCLCTMPNPAWYYMKVETPGNFLIHISTVPLHDVDFICWGPFDSLSYACSNQLTGNCTGCNGPCPNNTSNPSFYPSGNIMDCSYSVNSTEDCHINNAVAEKYYMLLITNYSNIPCNIIFSQTNTGQPGAGSTYCDLMPPPIANNGPLCVGDSLKLTATAVDSANYNWTGPNGFTSTLQNPVIPDITLANYGYYHCYITIGNRASPQDSTLAMIIQNPPTPVINLSGNVLTSSSQLYNHWYLNGVLISGATSQSYTITNIITDTSCYSDLVTNPNGCWTLSDTICLYPVGIRENANKNSVVIYTNPVNDKLIIETNSNKAQKFEIINLIGQTIYTSNINKKATVNMSAYQSGIYMLKLYTDKEIIVKKFIKE